MTGLRAAKTSFGPRGERPQGRLGHKMHWLAGAALCSLAVPGHAQDAAQDDTAAGEEADGAFGNEIIVTSERRATA